MQDNQEPNYRHREPDPDEALREVLSFLCNPLNSNAITAIATVLIFISGVVYTGFSALQWQATRQSADAATSAATTAAKQLEMVDRPWVIVSFIVNSPLVFGEDGMHLSLGVHLKNIGHSVATNIVIDDALFPSKDPLNEPLVRQRKLCEKTRKDTVGMNTGRLELTIFPDEEDGSLSAGATIDNATIAANLLDTHLHPALKTKFISSVYFVGCVDYQYATSTIHHQTQFIYEVGRIEPPRTFPMAIVIGQPIAADNVRLTRYIFGGFLAN
jgi:hypothetical protein